MSTPHGPGRDDATTVAIIDDDPAFVRLAAHQLEWTGFPCVPFGDIDELGEAGSVGEPAAVLLDWQLGGRDGIDLIPDLHRRWPRTPIVLVTGHPSVDLAVRALKAGAFDFLEKPLDRARLLASVSKAVDRYRLQCRIDQLERGGGPGEEELEGMIGASPPMRELFRVVRTVAGSDVAVLIQGESGTGKELVARGIHALSRRADGPFVAINMATLPAELVESTLFGHERGAFTGAERQQPGAVERAAGGTLFLDEICELPWGLQAKLLRFVQELSFRRVGGVEDLSADVRIVSASNRDMLEAVREQRFREDLFYRLQVVPIHLPPLRERPGDVSLIASRSLPAIAERHGRKMRRVSAEALERLETYPWPGNVRQLLNLLERIVVLGRGEVLTAEMIPEDAGGTADAAAGGAPAPGARREPAVLPLAEVELRAMERAIRLCNGSVSEAARRLNISPATIYRRFKAAGRELRGGA
jgi:DNA-binding NtrC family response regulator